MDSFTSKKIAFTTALLLGIDIVHLKAEPHTHDDHQEGPPIHGCVASRSANVVVTVPDFRPLPADFQIQLRKQSDFVP